MNAKKLIEILSKVPPDSRIVLDGWERGYNEANNIEHVRITTNENKPTRWHFEIGDFRLADDEEACEIAIFIRPE
jgi:hypothetical protein